MKKVAIVTLYGNFNYGNKLQNYALQTYLSSKGCEVYTLKNNHNTNYRRRYFIRYCLNLKRKFVSMLKMHNSDKRKEKKFILFNKKYIKYYDKFINTFNVMKTKFDLYVVGSDQVWNPNYGLDDVFLLRDVDNNKKIAYSASFGVTDLSNDSINKIKNEVNSFNKISVREYEAKEIIEKYTNRKDVLVTLDPTFLLSKEQWISVIDKEKRDTPKKYVLVYFLGNGFNEIKNDLIEYCRKNDCEIINVMDKESKYYDSNPFEFLNLIRYANIVLTDSFHACVFSIIFNKKFFVCERKEKDSNINNMKSRINSLMKLFDINNYYNNNFNDNNSKFNYEKCEEKIHKLRIVSDNFFESIIGDKNEK